MGQMSFLEMTGQSTEFRAGIGLFMTIGALLVWLFFYAQLTDDVFAFMLLSTLVAAFVVALWLCLAIRCPRCKAKIVWIAVHEHATDKWLLWLLGLTICPRCNFDPRSDSDSVTRRTKNASVA
jgi:hypothetical protein